MNDILYEMYKEMRQDLDRMEKISNKDDMLFSLLESCKKNIEAIESNFSDIKLRYERNKTIQNSFTQEQVDFICYQIGDWYLKWKNNLIVDGEKGQHRLGFAKEELKSMICGE